MGYNRARRVLLAVLVVIEIAGLVTLVAVRRSAAGQDAGAKVRSIVVTAHKYAFSPTRIEVDQDDIVKVTFETQDIPHSFTVDEPYRIAKRTAPGQSVVFEFRADQAGSFPFYCNLTIDDGCKGMKGELVVRKRTTGK